LSSTVISFNGFTTWKVRATPACTSLFGGQPVMSFPENVNVPPSFP
jgi:hypothetical protein